MKFEYNNIKYSNSCDRLKYRGLLYCTPTDINIDNYDLSVEDILRTFVDHTAYQIASEINKKNKVSVYITGGGVYNEFLINRLKSYTKNSIVIPSNKIVEFKEALIFGFLGLQKLK